MTSRNSNRSSKSISNDALQAKEILKKSGKEINKLSPLFDVLGNKIRFQVAVILFKKGPVCVSDLCYALGMSAPALSQHLRKMREKNIVTTKKEHKTVYYSLNKKHIDTLRSILDKV